MRGFSYAAAADRRHSPRMNDLSIHAGTVVCPIHGAPTKAAGCTTCGSYRGLGRANASVVCTPTFSKTLIPFVRPLRPKG